jgi:hypothetical protein
MSSGWECAVRTGTTEHVVSISHAEITRYGRDLGEPSKLVEESFRFLLEREPPSSILRMLAISDIARYFPDYPAEIGRRLG